MFGEAVIGDNDGTKVGNEVDAVGLLVGLNEGSFVKGLLVGLDEGVSVNGLFVGLEEGASVNCWKLQLCISNRSCGQVTTFRPQTIKLSEETN